MSESKFKANPAAFIPHIINPDREKLDALITKPEVERKLLQRVRNKARVFGQDFGPDGQPLTPLMNGNGAHDSDTSPPSPGGLGSGKIDAEGVVELYEHYIIPLTKEVEVGERSCHVYTSSADISCFRLIIS